MPEYPTKGESPWGDKLKAYVDDARDTSVEAAQQAVTARNDAVSSSAAANESASEASAQSEAAQIAAAAAEQARDQAEEITGIKTLDQGNSDLLADGASLTAQGVDQKITAEVPRAANSRPSVAKAVGETLVPNDLGKLAVWDSAVDFFVRLPQGMSPGQEFEIASLGAGSARLLPEAENLAPYPNARAGFAGRVWIARGTSQIELVSGAGPQGPDGQPMDVIRVTATAATASGGLGHAASSGQRNYNLRDLGLRAGDPVSILAWFAPPAGQSGRIQLRWYAGAAQIKVDDGSNATGASFRNIQTVVPEGATDLGLATITTASAAGQYSDLTAVLYARSTEPITTYADGDTAGWAWWGPDDSSPSTKGRVRGDQTVGPGSRSIVRKEADGSWTVQPVGPSSDTLLDTDTLTYDRDNGQKGMLAPAYPLSSSDTIAWTANRMLVSRVVPTRDMAIEAIAFAVTTAGGAGDECSVGVFDSAGARVVTSGAVAGQLGSTGTKAITVPTVLLRSGQVYYVALSVSSTATIRRGTVWADPFGTAIPALEGGYANTSHPIPAALPTLVASSSVAMLALREASVS